MASITLKNIPDGIHTHYKWLAKRNSRSLQAEIFLALEERAELGGLEKNLKADEVFGCLTSGKKGVTIEDMNRGIDEMFRKEWKR